MNTKTIARKRQQDDPVTLRPLLSPDTDTHQNQRIKMSTLHDKINEMQGGVLVSTVADIFEAANIAPPVGLVSPPNLGVAVDLSDPQEYALGIISSHSGWSWTLSFDGYDNDMRQLWEIQPVIMWLRAFFRWGGVPLWERLCRNSALTLNASQWWAVAFCPEKITDSMGEVLWPPFSENFIRSHLSALNPEA